MIQSFEVLGHRVIIIQRLQLGELTASTSKELMDEVDYRTPRIFIDGQEYSFKDHREINASRDVLSFPEFGFVIKIGVQGENEWSAWHDIDNEDRPYFPTFYAFSPSKRCSFTRQFVEPVVICEYIPLDHDACLEDEDKELVKGLTEKYGINDVFFSWGSVTNCGISCNTRAPVIYDLGM